MSRFVIHSPKFEATVPLRTDGDIRTLRLWLAMVVCPKCGSDRMIPLTFVSALGEDRTEMPRRAIAKCASCGERACVSVKAHRALSED